MKSLRIIFLLLMLVSCKKEVTIDTEIMEDKLVLYCTMSNTQSTKAFLTKTHSIYEYTDLKDTLSIMNEEISLYRNNVFQGLFVKDTGRFYSLPNFQPEIGDHFYITVDADGFEQISAQAIFTPSIQINNTDVLEIDSSGIFKKVKVKLQFDDRENEDNFYMVEVSRNWLDTIEHPVQYAGIQGYDPILLNQGYEGIISRKMVFPDVLFKNSTADIIVEFVTGYYDEDSLTMIHNNITYLLKLSVISEDYYEFLRSRFMYGLSNNQLPWLVVEPIRVYSNIVNGYGIFGVANSTHDTINIEGK